MTDMVIPPEAVKAAAKAIANRYGHPSAMYLTDASAALKAALPHLRPMFELAGILGRELGRREAAEEIAQAIENNHGWPTRDQQTALTFAAQVARNIAAREIATKEPK